MPDIHNYFCLEVVGSVTFFWEIFEKFQQD